LAAFRRNGPEDQARRTAARLGEGVGAALVISGAQGGLGQRVGLGEFGGSLSPQGEGLFVANSGVEPFARSRRRFLFIFATAAGINARPVSFEEPTRNEALILKSSIVFVTISLTVALCGISQCIAGEIEKLVVENSPQTIPEGGIRAELRGVRIVTTSRKFLESSENGVTVPENVVVEAVKRSPDLKKALNLPADTSELTFGMVTKAIQSTKSKNIEWKPSNQSIEWLIALSQVRLNVVSSPC